MATELLEEAQVDLTKSERSLLLVWQNSKTRRFVKVGQFDALTDGRFAFRYLKSAWTDVDFHTLIEFPERDGIYVSDELPAFFANRVLSADRSKFDEYVGWLGLEPRGDAGLALEVLARTGVGRATDTFHILDAPAVDGDCLVSRFFVSGIRHTVGALETTSQLSVGKLLKLELEESNPANRKAVLIDTLDGRRVGYVPDWLCDEIYDRVNDGWEFVAVTEQVNANAPVHVRVLCRIEARRV